MILTEDDDKIIKNYVQSVVADMTLYEEANREANNKISQLLQKFPNRIFNKNDKEMLVEQKAMYIIRKIRAIPALNTEHILGC